MKPRFLLLLTAFALAAGAFSFWFRAQRTAVASAPRTPEAVASAQTPPVPAPRENAAPLRTEPASPGANVQTPAPVASASATAGTLPPTHAAGIAARMLATIPEGDFRAHLMDLAPAARERALVKLARLQVPQQDFASLGVSPKGDLYYRCVFPPAPAAGIPAIHEPVALAAAPRGPQAAPVPVSNPPIRHSKPGATKVLYLDFNGHTITGTLWNSSEGVATYVAKPFSSDADTTTFSDSEQAAIIEIWSRVAEDFSPFDVDVTTEEPVTFTRYTGRAVITSNVDANGVNMPSSDAGGVAYLDVFGYSDYVATYSPALIYANNVGNSSSYIAEATSHELGHNLGLSHDGKTAPEAAEYYGGHGTGETSWGPLMGTGYGRNVSQWSKGEYYLASNTQDDFAIIAAYLGYRADEAGGTIAAPAVAGGTAASLQKSGVISNAGDVDVYVFNTTGGAISLRVDPFIAASGTRGGNADPRLELLDAAGNVLLNGDTPASTGVNVVYSGAPAGKYFVRLSASGTGSPLSSTPTGYTNYGSAGQYTLTCGFPEAAPLIVSATSATTPVGQSFSYAILGTNAPTSYSASGLPAGLSVDTTTGLITGRPTVTGTFTVALGATNALAMSSGNGTGTLTLTVTDAAPVITAQTSGRQSVVVANPLSLSVTALSPNSTPTYQWRRNGRVIAGATSATLAFANAAMTDAGVYRVYVTNTIGTTVSAPVFVQVAPLASAVTGWGSNVMGQTTIPGGLTNAIAIAAGSSHALALRSDGTVVAWGSNSVGQASVPAGLSDVVAISAAGPVSGSSPSYTYGYEYSLALKADGTLVGWGSGAYGTLDWPAGLSGVMAISAGTYHALALKTDGTVVAWGDNYYGQSAVPVGLSDVIAISAGAVQSLAVKADGTVVAWGSNTNGETSVPGGLTTAVEAGAGGFHSVALKTDGTVANWGFGSYGAAPGGFNTGRRLSAGYRHTLALKTDGTVAAWGSNTDGQTTVPGGITNAFDVAAGRYFSLALRQTSVPAAPAFTTHPTSQTVAIGGTATFTAAATGTPAPTLEWRKGGNPIFGATGATYTISPVAAGDAGSYTVVATNASGVITSNAAVLTVPSAFTTWLQGKFTGGELADANVSGPGADPDKDGLGNLIEYALGLEPKTAEATGLPAVSVVGSDWVYTYTRPSDRPGLTYAVEISTNLSSWGTGGVVHEMVTAGGGTETWRGKYPLASAANVFFRLKVTGQ